MTQREQGRLLDNRHQRAEKSGERCEERELEHGGIGWGLAFLFGICRRRFGGGGPLRLAYGGGDDVEQLDGQLVDVGRDGLGGDVPLLR